MSCWGEALRAAVHADLLHATIAWRFDLCFPDEQHKQVAQQPHLAPFCLYPSCRAVHAGMQALGLTMEALVTGLGHFLLPWACERAGYLKVIAAGNNRGRVPTVVM